MVKLGFIVEGETEKIILERSDFFSFLRSLNISYVPEVIDAKGNGNLLPQNIEPFTKTLKDKGANRIFILTDLDDDQCVTNTKARIAAPDEYVVSVSKQEIEAWFLSDTSAMKTFLKDPNFSFDDPQDVKDPFEEIRSIRLAKNNRGVGSKPILAQLMVRSGFSIIRAAEHPNCDSAKYFLDKIRSKA